jgi:hypothetical protein
MRRRTMWEPEGTEIDTGSIGSLTPEDVLFEYEEPLTYTSKDKEGRLLLVHSLSYESGRSRYLVVASDHAIVAELKAGRRTLLEALRQPRCWIADLGGDGRVVGLWSVEFVNVPEDVLPRPGPMITPELQSVFRVRLIGTGVGPGKTSAADVRAAAQAAELGLRILEEITLDRRRRAGRPSRQVRDYSDLPVQYLGAASFEIGLRAPGAAGHFGQDDEVFAEMGAQLDSALKSLRQGKAFQGWITSRRRAFSRTSSCWPPRFKAVSTRSRCVARCLSSIVPPPR